MRGKFTAAERLDKQAQLMELAETTTLSQAQMGKMLGVNQSTVCNWLQEIGRQNPGWKYARRWGNQNKQGQRCA